LNDLFQIFLNNLVPIFLIAGAGYLLSHYLNLSPQVLSHLVFYLFSPCLVFNLLTKNELAGIEILRMMLFSTILILLIGAITWVVGKMLRMEKGTLAATMLSSMFINAGNYGLPVVLFSFGEIALGYATLFFVTNAILVNVVGVVIASMGKKSFLQALLNILKVPTVYALILALLFMRTNWEVPLFLDRTFTLLSNASIPAMLVLMGIQFKKTSWSGKAVPISVATVLRLVISPIIAFFLTSVFGMIGPARQASILEAAMPSAVLNTVIATQFDSEPSLVSAAVFVTTILSPLTLTPLLAYLTG
jgi:malate permease and related proteins